MRVCGVEVAGNNIYFVIIERDGEMHRIVPCDTRKLELEDVYSSEQMKSFQKVFEAIVREHEVDVVVIKRKPAKGKHSSGAEALKIEAVIQLADINCEFITPQRIASVSKKTPMERPPEIKKYQEEAFYAAYAYMRFIDA